MPTHFRSCPAHTRTILHQLGTVQRCAGGPRLQLTGVANGCRAKNQGGKGGKAPQISFQDVAGVDSAKAELLEVVQCLKDAARYTRLNARMPSGVLLCGPPGTGKTLLGDPRRHTLHAIQSADFAQIGTSVHLASLSSRSKAGHRLAQPLPARGGEVA